MRDLLLEQPGNLATDFIILGTAARILNDFELDIEHWVRGADRFRTLLAIPGLPPNKALMEMIDKFGKRVSMFGRISGPVSLVDTDNRLDPRAQALLEIFSTIRVRSDLIQLVGDDSYRPIYTRAEIEDIAAKAKINPLSGKNRPIIPIRFDTQPYERAKVVYRLPATHPNISIDYAFLAPGVPSDGFPKDIPINVSVNLKKI